MTGDTVSILHGNTFAVSDTVGNIEASLADPQGLFASDTRCLSRWILTVNGVRPTVLSTDDLRYDLVQFFLVMGTGTVYVDADVSIMRSRTVDAGFTEDLLIRNEKDEAVDLDVRLDAAADFADLFEVKDAQPKKGELYQEVQQGLRGDRLVLGYRRDTFVRETWISTNRAAHLDSVGISFRVHIEPHGEWTARVDVRIPNLPTAELDSGIVARTRPQSDSGIKDVDAYLEAAPKLHCDWPPLERIYRRSLVDLAALRYFPLVVTGGALPAAGLPWFMSIFGRDSILTSLQALPFDPDLAVTTLRALAAWSGTRLDDFRDMEPGKILHELRTGELTAFEERPHSPYYGAADSTPLFLILLDEMERWTGNGALVQELETEARAALGWIDTYGDRDGDGYVEYKRRNEETGLENQCWKDSWNSILFADGSMSRLPRATCEIQGYVYDAKLRCARLARSFWGDAALADRLEREAAALKERFNRDFWVEERQCFALAIDGDGRQVDSLTSNIGHLLWSGIAQPEKAAACVDHLMGDQMFSGWGVRTMAAGEGGYNPIGYHVGTVWPFDNSLIAWGLARSGYRVEAARTAIGMLEAATYFQERLPEAIAGYDRKLTRFPVEYPTACSPQAWSAGAPLLLLQAMLGLEPVGKRLLVDPALPNQIGWLELLDIPGVWGRADAYGRGHVEVQGDAVGRTSAP
jgi:glycogen debranching enzyme